MPRTRYAERAARNAATLAWLDRLFNVAAEQNAAGVAILMQADMFDAFSVANNVPLDAFDNIVQRIAARAKAFGKPVLLLEGDSHFFIADKPLEMHRCDKALGKIGRQNLSHYLGEDPVGYAEMTVRKVWRMWSGGVGEAILRISA